MRKKISYESRVPQFKELKRSFTWERTAEHPTIIVDMYLKNNDGKLCFSCVWEVRCEAWGQCEDFINEYLKWDKLWDKIYQLWQDYHLNDLHAGTPKQEKLIRMGRLAWEDLIDYDKQCAFLDEFNCLWDENIDEDWVAKPYKYGSAWLYRPIPEWELWNIFILLTTE